MKTIYKLLAISISLIAISSTALADTPSWPDPVFNTTLNSDMVTYLHNTQFPQGALPHIVLRVICNGMTTSRYTSINGYQQSPDQIINQFNATEKDGKCGPGFQRGGIASISFISLDPNDSSKKMACDQILDHSTPHANYNIQINKTGDDMCSLSVSA